MKANILPIGPSTLGATNIGISARGTNKVGRTLTNFFYIGFQTSMRSLSLDSRVLGRSGEYVSMASKTGLATIFGNMVRHAASSRSCFSVLFSLANLLHLVWVDINFSLFKNMVMCKPFEAQTWTLRLRIARPFDFALGGGGGNAALESSCGWHSYLYQVPTLAILPAYPSNG